MVFDKLSERIQWAISKDGITSPTPIQEKAIPLLLAGKDVIGVAQTGTGKTASFVLPILTQLHKNQVEKTPNAPKVLVLSPTRELVSQIDDAFGNYGKFLKIKHKAIFGGVSKDVQISALKKGVHVVVASPGRLMDLVEHDDLDLSQVEYFVLDEAHTMLDMGFLDSIKEIFSMLSKNKQSSFWSATMTPDIFKLSEELLNDPVTIEIEAERKTALIEQKVCFLYIENKNSLLLNLVTNNNKTIIFMRTKYKTDIICDLLKKNGIKAGAIHKDKLQGDRTKSIEDFKSGKTKVLVATDIAARGIHIDDVTHVINYDIPASPDVYVHRIGRTARAGKSGVAYSFCSLEERELIRNIETYTGQKIEVMEHIHHAQKVGDATADDIVIKPKRKVGSAKMGVKRTRDSETYVKPINDKNKAKKGRAISKIKTGGDKYGRR